MKKKIGGIGLCMLAWSILTCAQTITPHAEQQSFGADAQLSPRNLVDPRRVEIKTADVTIKVDPDRTDLVQTRIINGVKYILVRVEEGVEVNGVPVQITE